VIIEEKFFTLRSCMLSLNSVSEFQPHKLIQRLRYEYFRYRSGNEGIWTVSYRRNNSLELSSGTVPETTGYEPLPIAVIIYRIRDWVPSRKRQPYMNIDFGLRNSRELGWNGARKRFWILTTKFAGSPMDPVSSRRTSLTWDLDEHILVESL
jgi:hypothetical protein